MSSHIKDDKVLLEQIVSKFNLSKSQNQKLNIAELKKFLSDFSERLNYIIDDIDCIDNKQEYDVDEEDDFTETLEDIEEFLLDLCKPLLIKQN